MMWTDPRPRSDLTHVCSPDARASQKLVIYVTVCGELVSSSDLLPARCPAECDDDPRYCPQCVHAALQWSAELGDDASNAAVVHLAAR